MSEFHMDIKKVVQAELLMTAAKKKFDAADKKRADAVKVLPKVSADKLEGATKAANKACEQWHKAFQGYEQAFMKFRMELEKK